MSNGDRAVFFPSRIDNDPDNKILEGYLYCRHLPPPNNKEMLVCVPILTSWRSAREDSQDVITNMVVDEPPLADGWYHSEYDPY